MFIILALFLFGILCLAVMVVPFVRAFVEIAKYGRTSEDSNRICGLISLGTAVMLILVFFALLFEYNNLPAFIGLLASFGIGWFALRIEYGI